MKLFWETGADLNLVVDNPGGGDISAARPGPSFSGGEFDTNSTTGCGGAGSFEHVSWPGDDAPVGYYHAAVEVADPKLCDGVEAPAWRMEVRVNNRLVKSIRGSGTAWYAVHIGESYVW